MDLKVIRDPIHGNIRLPPLIQELVDTSMLQRLRNIKQNGLCYLVYPAMNSTRFEHSLGTYHLSGLLADNLGLKEKDKLTFQAASLLHDIGHGPFSHTFDSLMARHGLDHELVSVELISADEISQILERWGLKTEEVCELVLGKGRLGKLLSSEVDVDKMDYLVRDAYYAGVAYGVTDVERLLYSIKFEKGDVVVSSGALEAMESLLINRNMMYQTVYRHHTKRIAESMIIHALQEMIDCRKRAREVFHMDDIELTYRMRNAEGYVADIMNRLDQRRLFKTAFIEKLSLLTEESQTELYENQSEIESKIAGDLGIDEGYLLLSMPESRMSEFKVKVETQEGLRLIIDVSPLAKSLEHSEREKLTVGVFVRNQDKRRFEDFNPEDYLSYIQTKISGYI